MRSFISLVALSALLAAAAPGRAAAAKDAAPGEHQEADHKAAEHGAEGDGKKIDLFKGAIDLSVWSIVVFLILFVLLSRFAWPQIRDGLDKRERSIAHAQHEAERAKREAAEVTSRLQADRAKADAEIRTMMDKARQDAAATAADELARGKAELAAERERQQRELRVSTDDALHRIWTDAAVLATSISAKAIRKGLSYDDHRALVSEALDEFKAAAGGRLDDLKSARA